MRIVRQAIGNWRIRRFADRIQKVSGDEFMELLERSCRRDSWSPRMSYILIASAVLSDSSRQRDLEWARTALRLAAWVMAIRRPPEAYRLACEALEVFEREGARSEALHAERLAAVTLHALGATEDAGRGLQDCQRKAADAGE